MSVQIIVFCDKCNPHQLHNRNEVVAIDEPRPMRRGNEPDRRVLNELPPVVDGDRRRGSSRITDGHAWFDGSPKEAMEDGWAVEPDGWAVCPRCRAYDA